jgi:hypothetical protein
MARVLLGMSSVETRPLRSTMMKIGISPYHEKLATLGPIKERPIDTVSIITP